MFIQIYDGVTGQLLKLPVTQLVVYNNEGTPIMVAAEFGTDRSQRIAKAGDPEFSRVLQAVGFKGNVIVEDLVLPEAPGKLINPRT